MRIAFCCIVDEAMRFQDEYQQWVIAHRLYSSDKIELQAYFINSIPERLKRFSAENNVQTKTVQQIVPGSPHCNKIIPFLDDSIIQNHDVVVVSDSDHHVVSDLSRYCKQDTLRLAPNNGNNPPLEKFKELFNYYDITSEVRVGLSLMANEKGSRETYLNNNSGGVIMMPTPQAKEIALEWKKWAVLLSENNAILGRWSIHVDQVAFSLAMETLGLDIDFLPAETNAVLKMIPKLTDIKAFHITRSHRKLFSKWFDENNLLVIPTKEDLLLKAIDNYNSVVRIYNKQKLKYAS